MELSNKVIFSLKSKTQVVLSKDCSEPYVFMVLSEQDITGITAIVSVFRVQSDPAAYKCYFADNKDFKRFLDQLIDKFQKFDLDIFKYDGIFDKEAKERYEEWKNYLT